MPIDDDNTLASDLLSAEREILTRVAEGGPLPQVLRDIILLVEKPSGGEMLASILLVSNEGKNLLHGAAPSLPDSYNEAVHGIPAEVGIGSCGTAAFTGNPVIVTDIANDPLWADYSDLATGYGLHACWSMPIKAADGRILGTFANYYREPRAPSLRDLEVISMIARTTAIAVERHLNEMARSRAEEQRLLVVHELNHRVKNVFALVKSLLAMSAKSATSVEDYARAVQGRMSALGRAHELVQPGLVLDNASSPGSVSARQLFADILAPYMREDDADRIVLQGSGEHLQSQAVTGMALILHELATNAAKYGALSTGHGKLAVTWKHTDVFEIVWREHGGPAITAPAHTGFGSTLTQRTVERQFHGKITHLWHAEGLEVQITFPTAGVLA